jgi:hypothetical protein
MDHCQSSFLSHLYRAMFRRFLLIASSLPLATACADKLDFNREIRPILSEKCYHCHGSDEGSRKAKLRLDVRTEAVKARDGVKAIVPGDLAESELVTRITSKDPDEVMPPPKEHHELSDAEREKLKAWIAEGAEYAPHWAFVGPAAPTVPGIADCGLRIADWEKRDAKLAAELRGQQAALEKWARSPIDAFILDRLLREGLTPSPEAPPEVLCRRLSLDLTAVAGGSGGLRRRFTPQSDFRNRQSGRSAARLAGLRRALGEDVARSRALRGLDGLWLG